MAKNKTPEIKNINQSKEKFIFPVELENSYRKTFGNYNLHHILLSVMAKKFKDDNLSKVKFNDVMRELAKHYKHHRTYANSTNFQNVYGYIIKSHIAYCLSAGDSLCKEIRGLKHIKKLKSSYEKKFNSLNEGDFIKRTLNLIFWGHSEDEGKAAPNDLIDLSEGVFKNVLEFSIVRYYQSVRNYEFHSLNNSSEIDNDYSKLNLDLIKLKYKLTPNKYPNLTGDDALICALAWIDVGRWLCKNMYSYEKHLLPEIKRRFENQKHRCTAASNFMLQSLLFTEEEKNNKMFKLKW